MRGHVCSSLQLNDHLFFTCSRPTAVNLADAAQKLGDIAHAAAAKQGASGTTVAGAVITACEQMLHDDVTTNKVSFYCLLQHNMLASCRLSPTDSTLRQAMGQHGAEGILQELKTRGHEVAGVNMLTHCNTGSLACAGFGTALGVVRSLHGRGCLQHVYCTETRPYNQGEGLVWPLFLGCKALLCIRLALEAAAVV